MAYHEQLCHSFHRCYPSPLDTPDDQETFDHNFQRLLGHIQTQCKGSWSVRLNHNRIPSATLFFPKRHLALEFYHLVRRNPQKHDFMSGSVGPYSPLVERPSLEQLAREPFLNESAS